MKFSSFLGYFHDGNMIDIFHKDDQIIFHLESAVIEEDFEVDPKISSKESTIKGSLHIHGIKSIMVNSCVYLGLLTVKHESGQILKFNLSENECYLLIEWMDFPPKSSKTDVSGIRIAANNFTWVPEL